MNDFERSLHADVMAYRARQTERTATAIQLLTQLRAEQRAKAAAVIAANKNQRKHAGEPGRPYVSLVDDLPRAQM